MDSGSQTSSAPEKPIQPYIRPTRGPWRDAQCLELVTSTPGFSRVCNACIQLFRENSEHFLQQPLEDHIQFLDTLVKSAQRGCLVCALLLNKVERLVGDVEIPSELQLTYALGVKYVDIFFSCCKSLPSRLHLVLLRAEGGSSQPRSQCCEW